MKTKTIRLGLYIDDTTENNLEILSKKYQRSKNNLIAYLINKEVENEKKEVDGFLKEWTSNSVDYRGLLDNVESLRDFAYDD